MNPYYYLFYKLSRFLNKKGNNEWGPIYGISIFFGWTIVVVYVKIFQITEGNPQGLYKTILGIMALSLFVLNCILFLNKNRVKGIMSRYKGESKTSRIIGNGMLILYVVLSLGLIIFV